VGGRIGEGREGEGKHRKEVKSLKGCGCTVLMGWSLLPNAQRPFKIYCAPLNLSNTRTWICQLHFAQKLICWGL